jgi:hypothetical protein
MVQTGPGQSCGLSRAELAHGAYENLLVELA